VSYINNRTVHDLKKAGTRLSAAALMEAPMMHIGAAQAESSTGGILVRGPRNAVALGVSIDTRTLRAGDLFFAIRGPKNDGHQYVGAALEKGAAGVVVDHHYSLPEAFPQDRILLMVGDTHQALKDLAADARRQWRGSLIGITGSMGKTTAKDFAAQVLQTEFSVYRSPGNYNNLFGLPLAVFGLSDTDHIGIFEMGMSVPGEIAEMCRIAKPALGVITNVAPVHLEFFKSLEDIARAKGELAESLPADGTLIYNADDLLVQGIAARFPGHKISFGRTSDAQVFADQIETVGLQETRFRLHCAGLSLRALIPLAGTHFVMNALPAVALGLHYRINLEQIVESLRHLEQALMRGQIIRLGQGIVLIDDSYNSNPRALAQMTETISRLPCENRRILVAGEMLELGEAAPALHYECGSLAARSGVDVVVAIQGAAREIARGAAAAGLPQAQAHFFPDVETAIEFIAKLVQPGDLLLVKGSRGVRLERVVLALKSRCEEPAP